MLELRQVTIPFEFMCMNVSNIVAALQEFSKTSGVKAQYLYAQTQTNC